MVDRIVSITALCHKLKTEHRTNDPFVLCEKMDIVVLEVDLPQSLNGFFIRLLGSRFIYLNKALPQNMRRIVCAHELGHALLHTEEGPLSLLFEDQSRDEREREANLFCAGLLLDEADILRSPAPYYNTMRPAFAQGAPSYTTAPTTSVSSSLL